MQNKEICFYAKHAVKRHICTFIHVHTYTSYMCFFADGNFKAFYGFYFKRFQKFFFSSLKSVVS